MYYIKKGHSGLSHYRNSMSGVNYGGGSTMCCCGSWCLSFQHCSKVLFVNVKYVMCVYLKAAGIAQSV